MRYLFFICCAMLWCRPLSAEGLHLTTDTSDIIWIARDARNRPESDHETLALRSVATKSTITQDRLTAYYLGKKNSFDFVTVEDAPETVTEGFHGVSSYLIRDDMIWFDTRLTYVAKTNPEHEQVAREMATDYRLGRGGAMPAFFKGSVYLVDYDGKCILTVLEMDENNTVQFTYRYNCCE